MEKGKTFVVFIVFSDVITSVNFSVMPGGSRSAKRVQEPGFFFLFLREQKGMLR